jgi:hypothetical protein
VIKSVYGINQSFFCDFRHSNPTSEVSVYYSNVLFVFFDFCSCRVLSKTEENTGKYFLIKKICKEQKIWRPLQKSHEISSWAHEKCSSSKVRKKNFVLTKF